jgi:hypothetical protein
MVRKLATVALCISSLACASDTTIAAKHLMASSQRYNVTHDANGFKVNGQRVEHYDLDASLRKPNALKNLFKSDRSRLEVSRIGAGYALKQHQSLRGGGGGGAWLGSWLGYGGVMAGSKLITAGLTYATVLVFPPAAPVVAAVADTILTVVAQPVAITAGVGCGIALGVATGPV